MYRQSLVLIILMLTTLSAAADGLSAPQRAAIASRFGVAPADIKPAPIAGWYQIHAGSDVAYVSADGRYLFKGELVDTQKRVNLTQETQQQLRRNLLDTVTDKSTIVYAPAQPKHVLTVFTDLDCGYCRRLHQAMPQLLNAGIEVRYLFYPRAGEGSAAWRKAEAIWCSSDRKASLDKGFSGQPLGQPQCDAEARIRRDYRLAHEIGATGTPTIIMESGRIIHGLPPISALIEAVKTQG